MIGRALLAIVAAACLLAGCEGKRASVQDVQSTLIKSISLASESETFIEYLNQGRFTFNFAEGHLEYLRSEVNRADEQIEKLHADPGLTNALKVERAQLRALQLELDRAWRNVERPGDLAKAVRNIREVRTALQRMSSSL